MFFYSIQEETVVVLAKITASYRKRNRNIGSTVRVNDNRCFGVQMKADFITVHGERKKTEFVTVRRDGSRED